MLSQIIFTSEILSMHATLLGLTFCLGNEFYVDWDIVVRYFNNNEISDQALVITQTFILD